MPEDAEVVQLGWRMASALTDALIVNEARVLMSRRGASSMELDVRARTVMLDVHEELSPAAIVHPMSTTPLSILARWRGDMTFHAGAVLVDGVAFGICGEREAGKSSMLAELTADGTPIVTDDLLVVDGREVLSGPRCIDLRPGAAERFGARSMGTVSMRERFRVSRTPAPPRVPLGGLFALEWRDQDEPTVEALDLGERLQLLYGQEYSAFLGPHEPQAVIALLDLPMWRLRRRQSWDASAPAAAGLRAAARATLGGEPGELEAAERPSVR